MAKDGEFPQTFGKYTLLAQLGQGGMAEVFLALLTGPGGFRKLVVIKRTHKHLLDEEGFVDMFLDEARLAARLSHPNVVQTHEVDVLDGRPYLAMEYLEGQPLNRILGRRRREGGRLPYPILAHLFLGVLDGLHYAHTLTDFDGMELKVVHRDVSPHNLFVTYHGVMKVLDFGVAKAAGRIVQSKTGEMKGKLSYSPPDQAKGLELDARADVWSCGVILWQATANRSLFRADNDMATIHNVMSMQVPLLDTIADDVPPAFARVVDTALLRDRSARWESAEAMREALSEYLTEVTPAPTHKDVDNLVTTLFAEERESHRRIIEEALAGQAPSPTGLKPVISSTPTTTNTTVEEIQEVRRRALRKKRRTIILAAAGFGILIGTSVPIVSHLMSPPKVTKVVSVSGIAPVTPGPAKTVPIAVVVPTPVPSAGSDTRPVKPAEASVAATAPKPAPAARIEPAPPVAKPRRARRPTRPRAPLVQQSKAQPTPKPAPKPVPKPIRKTGSLTIDTTPWSEVWLGKKKLGTTPLIAVSLPVGTHTLTLKNPERKLKKTYQVTIKEDETTKKRLGLD